MDIKFDKNLVKRKPFQYYTNTNVLDEEFALNIQKEILEIPVEQWDRYDNPFEQKYTLRDKNNMPMNCKKLYDYLESEEFIKKFSEIVGYNLIKDDYKNFWGIHKYDDGDYLDIHVDAGIHPKNKLKKQITLGFYFSKDWKEENLGHLELWTGDNASNDDAKIYECVEKILPKLNTIFYFECDDYSWHGNPTRVIENNGEKRILLTISYLSENFNDLNKRQKAFFVPRPEDPYDEKKDKLRFLRADPEKYKDVYRFGMN